MKYSTGKMRAFTDSLDDNGNPLPEELVIGGKSVTYKPAKPSMSTQSKKQPNSEKPSETALVTPTEAIQNNVEFKRWVQDEWSPSDPVLRRKVEALRAERANSKQQ